MRLDESETKGVKGSEKAAGLYEAEVPLRASWLDMHVRIGHTPPTHCDLEATRQIVHRTPLLEASSITKSFGELRVLRDVDVCVDSGEIVCLLGPNGAGKTTLTTILAGLMQPDRGRVSLCGTDVIRRPQVAHRYLGFAPQETGVYPMLDVCTNLRVFCELAGLRGRAVSARIDQIVESLLLTELTTRRVQELSGGERRRLHVGIALVAKPALLLLDEPSVGADVETRRRLTALVRELASEGSGILYSTHYLGEVEGLGGSVMILHEGSVIANGSVDEVLANDEAAVLELVFAGSAPTIDELELQGACLRCTRVADTIRIATLEPGLAAARTLALIGEDAVRLQSIKTLRPTLEDLVASLSANREGSMERNS